MRQLIIWAAQKVQQSRNVDSRRPIAENLVQALLSNQINTSWYQRPSNKAIESNSDSNTGHSKGPKNQELKDCIQLYSRYADRLRTELEVWRRLLASNKTPLADAKPTMNGPSSREASGDEDNKLLMIHDSNEWFGKIPESTEQLHWMLSVTNNFESHSRTFCENVFHAIRNRLFGSKCSESTPLFLLKALSSTSEVRGAA